MTTNEWGLQQAAGATSTATATVTATSTAVDVGVGAAIGAAVGALGGAMVKHPGVGGVVGAVAGGGIGYYYSKKQAAAAPSVLPAGPYNALSPAAGQSTITLNANETYLASAAVPAGQTAAQIASSIGSMLAQAGASVVGQWSGFPPAGWPATDINASGGVFFAFTMGGKPMTGAPGTMSYFTTGGAAS